MITRHIHYFILGVVAYCLTSCNKLEELTQNPETSTLQQGFQTSAAIGYCASLAAAAFKGEQLSENVSFTSNIRSGYAGSGILHVQISENNPLPFNKSTGDIYIVGLWNGKSGVISIIFADINIITSTYKLSGIHTVPIMENENGEIVTLFADQDIVTGEGSDTLVDLSLSQGKFSIELARLDANRPTDFFVAIKQNVWFITIDQMNSIADVYDDVYSVTGGGQIVEVRSQSGGVLYHAMIDAEFSPNNCTVNPTEGTAFVQNIKASGSLVDLGNLTLQFHNECDGGADVMIATGKYVGSNGRNISLNWN